ncbi:penicillin-binding protein 1C [Campylobacter helveticus]|uniref:penicillin-binding protein 1C n=1 Tax=Campylobacter helveticus TaxID=28898 RepID=UPI002149AB5B|nr:penicillin-binding protein 1C [Campylobacter helveticus]MCR2065906.1 penicillin-binding protein 1C [Campylobacter helveticus]
MRLLLCFLAICLAFVNYFYFSFDEKRLLSDFEKRYSKVLYDKNEELLSVFLNEKEQFHIKTNAVPQRLKTAVLAYEDKDFYTHNGVDFSALLRAFRDNLFKAKRSGASTLTMQTIKLWGQNERTYFNKFKEMIQSFALENALSKEDILKLYLSNAPYGGNLVGYEAALLFYFDTQKEHLTWAQSALLAILPNQPGLINLEKNKPLLLQKRNALLKKLYEKNAFSKELYELSLKEPLPKFKARKNIAPHLALRMLNDENKVQISSIDKNLQLKFEEKAAQFSKKLKQQGIRNLAIILADTKSYKTLAYVGSQDFYDMKDLGQINGAAAKRSVGSILKPFLYALSIDEGLVGAKSLVLDVPTYFSNFSPKNANQKYYGLIPLDEALQKSLNVPFVALLQEYGYEKFFYKLREFLDFKEENYKQYGLSLILGTKEFSLEEMTKLYLGLGNYGVLANLSFLRDESLSGVKKMFSSGSASLTLEALKDVQRLGLERFNADKVISWKTGTSYGRKDAWAMGVTPKYTLGVWAGNFSGEENANLYGVSVAGELLFELFGLLDSTNLAFENKGLRQIKLDTPSKYRYDESLGGAYTLGLYPVEAKVLKTSPFLKKSFEFEGKKLDSLDENFTKAKAVVKFELPTFARSFLEKENITFKGDKNLKILYPKSNLKLILARDFDGKKPLIIKVANLNQQKLFWYLNKTLLYEGEKMELSLNLSLGEYELFIIGENGEFDTIKFSVEGHTLTRH